MGGGGDPRRGGRWCARRGDLRGGAERVRLLRAVAGEPNRQSDGGSAPAARARPGDEDHRQGHVPHVVIVQKYGGTSVGSAARIRRVSRRIANTVKQGQQVVAVVSAMGHTTDRLIALAQSVNAEPPARELDMLVANGETITAPLVAMCLQGMGVPAVSLSGAQAGVRTSEHHSRARIRDIKPDRIVEALRKQQVPVVAGFQGVTEELEITTLGRGGSDTTAVALAAAIFEPLGAAGISVDVIVQNIGRSGHTDLTFSVAESDLKAAEKLVKVAAKSVGATRVSSAAGIAKLSIVGTGMLGAPGIAARMFRALADAGVNIEMISTSEIRITCMVSRDQVEKGVRILHKAFELDIE